MLENIYLCGINNNLARVADKIKLVVICLKISIFVVSTTTLSQSYIDSLELWFAWKYLSLWYQQQRCGIFKELKIVVICLKISIFVVSTTTQRVASIYTRWLWFAWKYLSLWYQQQPASLACLEWYSCDLLENIYLCGINNNTDIMITNYERVVICLKISTFVVSTTTNK